MLQTVAYSEIQMHAACTHPPGTQSNLCGTLAGMNATLTGSCMHVNVNADTDASLKSEPLPVPRKRLCDATCHGWVGWVKHRTNAHLGAVCMLVHHVYLEGLFMVHDNHVLQPSICQIPIGSPTDNSLRPWKTQTVFVKRLNELKLSNADNVG